ncbi:hypothetical protein G7054_g11176 [Neopestalotiopsis clavispora]|nr:hypothetical protein G7054_g11176 [Neopestalotiopsis clavispora]
MEDEEHIKTSLQGLTVEAKSDVFAMNEAEVKKEDDSAPGSSGSRSRSHSMSPDQKPRSDSASTPDVNGAQPQKSRKGAQKSAPRQPPLFDHLPDVTEEATGHFQLIPDCLYGSKSLGASEHDTLDCDCAEEWRDGKNHACGEDADCINRITKMECFDRECNCGDGCENQRFQHKRYANVSVIKTEKKGFGLRANSDLQANAFIYEYIGEVINEPTFRRRMMQYDQEGIKHFYFMSLHKNEFVDATKKGNLGRFCNHSCNPNCYVDKWCVGPKMRMGIFTSREVKAGEELVFNYNVDRYGADPQPCYCGESNCIGFIGGKTQTERATKLSAATIEALGIDDADSWDTAVAVVKKPRKKRVEEDDEDYVNSVQARGLDDEKGVQKVMASLMQCKEKWIAAKLLERIERCEERLLPSIVRVHGYEILKTTLNSFKDDHNLVLQILHILNRFPRLTRNKITDSKIDVVVQPLITSEHENIAAESKELLETWSKLETGYRIPRKARNAHGAVAPVNSFEERRGTRFEEPQQKATIAVLPDNVPKGPRNSVPQRNMNVVHQPRQRRPPDQSTLPPGWFVAYDQSGKYYFYTKGGTVQWHKPTVPAPESFQTAPSRAVQEQKTLQDLIDSVSKPKSATQTPQQVSTPAQDAKKEKWRSYPVEKQMKIYENTLFPHVKYVMDKFRNKLPKEDLKKFAKEVNKKLVASDYKNHRVEDPNTISKKQEQKIKSYVKDFFDKAVVKYNAAEKKKKNDKLRNGISSSPKGPLSDMKVEAETKHDDEDDIVMTDDEGINSTPSEQKRKRDEDDDTGSNAPEPYAKRVKEEEAPTPPPPPPPPPAADTSDNVVASADSDTLRQQEAELERENELNRLEFEREQLGNGDQQQSASLGE